VFRHGIGLGLCERDITSDFRGLLEAPTVEHHAAITDPAAVGALLCKIDRYAGRALTRLALKLSPLVFVRPHNLRISCRLKRLGVRAIDQPADLRFWSEADIIRNCPGITHADIAACLQDAKSRFI
jgi:hypothetical protein